MDDETLLHFLEIGVIDVGGDDAKLDKLRVTVKDLRDELIEKPAKTSVYTLVAADPSITATDPTVQEVMTALKKHWTTVANTFSSTPIAIIRAMLLDAITQAARQDDAIAVAFVNSARNVLPYLEIGHEQPIWENVVKEIETKIDLRAETEWATPEMISLEPMSYKSSAEISVTPQKWIAERKTLQIAILRATGPQGGEPQNPHWPSNQPQHWATEFSNRLTTVLADTIEDAVAKSAIEPINLSPHFKTLAETVYIHLQKALAAFSGATAGLQRRTNLLWWKEALYSPSAHVSYRDLTVFNAAALMALDLFEQVPTYSPASVSAFLNETIQMLPANTDAVDRTVLALVIDARSDVLMAPIREVAVQLFLRTEGRCPLLSLIGHTNTHATLDSTTFPQLGGIGAEVTVSPSDWGTWLFRELQAARATYTSN